MVQGSLSTENLTFTVEDRHYRNSHRNNLDWEVSKGHEDLIFRQDQNDTVCKGPMWLKQSGLQRKGG